MTEHLAQCLLNLEASLAYLELAIDTADPSDLLDLESKPGKLAALHHELTLAKNELERLAHE